MLPSPTSSKGEHVFLVGTHTNMHIHYTYTRKHAAGHTGRHRQTMLGTYTNTNSTNGFILYPFLADEGEGVLVGNDTRALWVHPVAARGSLVSLCAGTQAGEPPRPQPHSSCRCRHLTRTHTNICAYAQTHTHRVNLSSNWT